MSIKAGEVHNAVCPHCKHQFTAIPKRSFLGFQKLTCPECKENVVYPLTSGYRTTYWVLLVFMVLSIVGSFSRGEIGVPGGLGIAVAIALTRDWSIKKNTLAQSVESKLQQELPSLILAAAEGNDELVTSILNSGTQPNITGPDGQPRSCLPLGMGTLQPQSCSLNAAPLWLHYQCGQLCGRHRSQIWACADR
ncbi:MAG: hypothetical protein Q7K57_27275 [Burkholderiaceae bacterium]|nr:hypothetical protein [Burkholderiaceae bacterium]